MGECELVWMEWLLGAGMRNKSCSCGILRKAVHSASGQHNLGRQVDTTTTAFAKPRVYRPKARGEAISTKHIALPITPRLHYLDISYHQDLSTFRTTSICRPTHIHLPGIPPLLSEEDDQECASCKTNETFSQLTRAINRVPRSRGNTPSRISVSSLTSTLLRAQNPHSRRRAPSRPAPSASSFHLVPASIPSLRISNRVELCGRIS